MTFIWILKLFHSTCMSNFTFSQIHKAGLPLRTHIWQAGYVFFSLPLSFSLNRNVHPRSAKKGPDYYGTSSQALAAPSPLSLGLCTVPHAWLTATWMARDDSGCSHGHPLLLFPITMEEVSVYREIYGAAKEVASSVGVAAVLPCTLCPPFFKPLWT